MEEYDIIRVIVTVLVLIGHCTYYIIATPYGGCDYSALAFPKLSLLYRFANSMTKAIYVFHMPLFISLSGAVTAIGEKHYIRYRSFLKNRFMRLICPFFLVTPIYATPIKFLTGYFTGSDNIIRDVIIGQFLLQGNTHLWFLPTLFSVAGIVVYMERCGHGSAWIKLAIYYVMYLVSGYIPIHAVQYIMQYMVWFYVGFQFEKVREKANSYVITRPYSFGISILLFFGSGLLSKLLPLNDGILKKMIISVVVIFGYCSIYTLSILLAKVELQDTKIFKMMLSNSFGLYLYSDPLNYVILCCLTKYLGGAIFTVNLYSALALMTRFVISTGVALAISAILKKCGLTYIS